MSDGRFIVNVVESAQFFFRHFVFDVADDLAQDVLHGCFDCHFVIMRCSNFFTGFLSASELQMCRSESLPFISSQRVRHHIIIDRHQLDFGPVSFSKRYYYIIIGIPTLIVYLSKG